MNIFQNISIRSRFNIITISVIALILFVIIFFLFTFNKVRKYNQYNEKTNQLKVHYLNMRRFEQHFLLRYNEDPNFFITGENTYIEKLQTTSSAISDLIINLSENQISENLKLSDILNEVEIIHQNYIITFNDLTGKTFKKGSYTTGITGDLKISGNKTYESANSSAKNRISKMIEYSDNYLYTNDEKYYTAFLKEYEKLIAFPINVINDTTEENSEQTINKSPGNFLKSLTGFKSNFTALVKINKELGVTYKEGLEGELRSLKFKPLEELVQIVNQHKIEIEKKSLRNIYIFFIIISILFFILFWRFSNSIVMPLNRLRQFIKPLSRGILPEETSKLRGKNEISSITESINELIVGLKKTTDFALSIGQGEYKVDFNPLSENDSLGNALIEMRGNLISSQTEEEKRKQEDEIRTWTNVGLTKFNDILRQSQGNIKEMSVAVISDLVKFIDANQGGMFVFNDDEDDRFLELTAAYAYGQEKKKQKKIYPGEGIVGTVAVEKETVYMTDIPETYITITSGLGGSKPRSLLIVPMIVEEEIIGVIELASFNRLNKHEIDFVETLSENIASSLSITRINQKTSTLFEQSQRQTELMKVQEEEMRQNFEELQQVQEESSRNTVEMASILDAIDSSSSVFNIEPDGTISSVNQQFLMLTNLPADKIVGIHLKEFFVLSNEEEYNMFWEMLVSGENIQKDEYLNIDNAEFWFSVVYRPIIDNKGNLLYIFAVGTNLTESKKLELELKDNISEINKAHKEAERKQHILENTNEMMKANEKTLQSAVENAMKQRKELAKKVEEIAEEEALSTSRLEGINQTNITIQFDLKGSIISVNKIFEKTFSYNIDELKGKNIKSLLTEQFISSKEYADLWERLLAGMHVNGTFNFIGKETSKIFAQGTFTAIKDRRGKTASIFFVGFNTTDLVVKTEELKARETELFFQIQDMQMLQDQSMQQQEELTVKAIETAEKESITKSWLEGINQTNIIAELDLEGNFQSVNENFLKLFEYKEKEIISKSHNFIVSEANLKTKVYKENWESLEKGDHITGSFQYLGKNKKKIYLQGTYTVLKDASEKPTKIVFVGFDTTNLLMKTEELKARETELFFQIQDMQQLQDQIATQQEEITLKALEIAENEAISQSRFKGIEKTNLMAELDTNGIILDINDLFTTTLGYLKEDLVSKNHKILITEEFATSEQYEIAWAQLLKGEYFNGEFPFLNINKEKLFVQGTFTAIKDASGKTSKIMLIGIDNTELVMKTEELKARETELEFKLDELNELEKKLKKE